MHSPPRRPTNVQRLRTASFSALIAGSSALFAACDNSTTVTELDGLTLRRSTILVGSITRTDSVFSGQKATASSYQETLSTAASGSQIVAAIPGTKVTIAIAQRSKRSLNLTDALSSLDTVTFRTRGVDSSGRLNDITISRLGGLGPTVRVQHLVNGRLLATIQYEWRRVEGGWLLDRQRVAVFADNQMVSVTTIDVRAEASVLASIVAQSRLLGRTITEYVLPRRLEAAEPSNTPLAFEVDDEEGPCSTEFAALVAAGAVMGAVCLGTGPNPLCALASIAYIGASEAWQKCRNGGEE